MRIILAAIAIGVTASGCSSGTTPQSPTAPSTSTPAPAPMPFNIAGNWSGTFASSNLPTRTIVMTIVQASSCVDGAWKDASGQWTGAISGLADAVSFSGQISFQRTAGGGGACGAVANVQGSIGTDGIHWTATTFTPTQSCTGDLPQSTVITLQPAS
jgi:uncharacterized protein YceK